METARHDSIDFFLGATTPAGFKGYFEPLRHEPGMQMYLIKSGPGCGKSTLMPYPATFQDTPASSSAHARQVIKNHKQPRLCYTAYFVYNMPRK